MGIGALLMLCSLRRQCSELWGCVHACLCVIVKEFYDCARQHGLLLVFTSAHMLTLLFLCLSVYRYACGCVYMYLPVCLSV